MGDKYGNGLSFSLVGSGNPNASYLWSDEYTKSLMGDMYKVPLDTQAAINTAASTSSIPTSFTEGNGYNKYGVYVGDLQNSGFKGDINSFETQSAADNYDMGDNFNTNDKGFPFMDDKGLFGMDKAQWGTLGQAAGLAGTAYGIYSNLWGDKADLFKEQLGMLRDQRAYNQKMIADRDKYKANIGSGLAAAFTKDK